MDDVIIMCGCSYQNAVSAYASGCFHNVFHLIGTFGRIDRLYAVTGCYVKFLLIKIYSDHTGACSFKELGGNKTYKSKADDDDILAKLRLQQSDALQSD